LRRVASRAVSEQLSDGSAIGMDVVDLGTKLDPEGTWSTFEYGVQKDIGGQGFAPGRDRRFAATQIST